MTGERANQQAPRPRVWCFSVTPLPDRAGPHEIDTGASIKFKACKIHVITLYDEHRKDAR